MFPDDFHLSMLPIERDSVDEFKRKLSVLGLTKNIDIHEDRQDIQLWSVVMENGEIDSQYMTQIDSVFVLYRDPYGVNPPELVSLDVHYEKYALEKAIENFNTL